LPGKPHGNHETLTSSDHDRFRPIQPEAILVWQAFPSATTASPAPAPQQYAVHFGYFFFLSELLIIVNDDSRSAPGLGGGPIAWTSTRPMACCYSDAKVFACLTVCRWHGTSTG
jgi:hypothetical protein